MLDPLTQKLIGSGSPFELTGEGSAQREYKIYRHAPSTLSELYQRALKRGERELIVFGNARLSLHQSLAAAERAAAVLEERYAIGPGCRVGVVADSTPEWFITFLAITSLGAVPVLIGHQDATQIEHCINVARCALVIADADAPAASVVASPSWLDVGDLLAEAERRQPQASRLRTANASDEAIVLFTSGSTGNPKAVSLTHRNVITGLMNMMLGSALAAAEHRDRNSARSMQPPCALIHTPLCYIGGLSAVLMTVMNGTRMVVTSGWNIDEVCALIGAERVTAIPHIGRAQLEQLLAHDGVTHRLTSIGMHGASVPRRLIEHISASIPTLKIVSGYGLTETGGSIAVISGSTLRSRPGSSGRIVPTVGVSLGAPVGRAAGSGTGELFVSGACIMRGYLQAGQVADIAWFNTGDVAHIAEDGHLYLDHRSSESSIIDGARFNTASVERDLEDLQGVSEACVLISPHPPILDVVVAMTPGSTLERSTIESALQTIGATTQVRIHFHDSLPRTASGKINRAALRATVSGTKEGSVEGASDVERVFS